MSYTTFRLFDNLSIACYGKKGAAISTALTKPQDGWMEIFLSCSMIFLLLVVPPELLYQLNVSLTLLAYPEMISWPGHLYSGLRYPICYFTFLTMIIFLVVSKFIRSSS